MVDVCLLANREWDTPGNRLYPIGLVRGLTFGCADDQRFGDRVGG